MERQIYIKHTFIYNITYHGILQNVYNCVNRSRDKNMEDNLEITTRFILTLKFG